LKWLYSSGHTETRELTHVHEVCSMSKSTTQKYSAACKQRAVKLAVESDQPIAQTARDLGVNENT
jgi:hypothetical protein